MTGAVIKFPIGRVVREHRIGASLSGSPELDAIERSAISIRRAITTLRRQHATLNLLADRARKKVTPEQRAAAGAENMRRIYAREDEDRAAKPLNPHMVEVLRKIVAEADAAAEDDDNDGGSAA